MVELYGLNRSVTTTHLESFLLDFLWQGCAANVKWVDDEHALAVFPCAAAAQALLDSGQRSYKVRPYAAASTAAQRLDSDGARRMLLKLACTCACSSAVICVLGTFPPPTPSVTLNESPALFEKTSPLQLLELLPIHWPFCTPQFCCHRVRRGPRQPRRSHGG